MVAFLSNWLILYPIAFSLFVAMQLSETTADRRKISVGVLVLRLMIFILFVFSLLAAGCRTSALSLVWLVMFGVTAIVLLIKQSRLNRSAITLTILACRDLPQIKQAVAYFAEEHGGLLGRKLHTLRLLLAQGLSWSIALQATGFCYGTCERLTARLADRFGHSSKNGEEKYLPLRVEIEMERLLSRLSILVWILLFGPLFLMFQILIVPSLMKLMNEFDVAPNASLELISTFDSIGWLSGSATLFAILVLVCTIPVWMAPRLTAYLPFRLFCGAYYRCLGFIALSRVSEHTSDLSDACRQTAEIVPVSYIATKFRTAFTCLERGQSPADAFAIAELLRRNQLDEFTSILGTTGLAWATRELASVEVERMLYRYSLLIQFLIVVFTLGFAILTGIVAVGLFQALSSMIQWLA